MLSPQFTTEHHRPDLSCTYIAHHEPGSIIIVAIVIAVIEHTSHVFVIVTTVINTTSYKVAAVQHQPFRAGDSNQHCSSACGSSVEPGAADAAPIVIIVIKLTSRIVAAEQDQCFGSGKAEQHCSSPCCSSVEPGSADIVVIVISTTKLLLNSQLTLLLQSKINLSVLASLTSIAAARAAQVWSQETIWSLSLLLSGSHVTLLLQSKINLSVLASLTSIAAARAAQVLRKP